MRNLTEVKVNNGKLSILGIYILKSLEEGPKTGYDIIREIREKTNGVWTPPKSTIYPLLRKLENMGLVERDEHGRYVISDDGKRLLEEVRSNSEDYKKKLAVLVTLASEAIFGEVPHEICQGQMPLQ